MKGTTDYTDYTEFFIFLSVKSWYNHGMKNDPGIQTIIGAAVDIHKTIGPGHPINREIMFQLLISDVSLFIIIMRN